MRLKASVVLLFLLIYVVKGLTPPSLATQTQNTGFPNMIASLITENTSPEVIKMFAVSHAATALGFSNFVYFFSVGYGLATASVAVVGMVLKRETLNNLSLLHSLGVLCYGLRLAVFLFWREKSSSFQQHQSNLYEKTGGKPKSPPVPAKLIIWPAVSTLYVLLYYPCYCILAQGLNPNIGGIVIMYFGLAIESVADYHKSKAKAANPGGFVRTGLYRLSRHINYLGEILMWLGVWIAGIPGYTSAAKWVVNALGPIFMVWLMTSVTASLDRKQLQKYGGDAAYMEYVQRVPMLVPFTRAGPPPPGKKKD